MIVLPGVDDDVFFSATLHFVEEVERVHGNFYALAREALAAQLALETVRDILTRAYRHAGCDMADISGMFSDPEDLLGRVLLSVLDPVERMGAVLINVRGEKCIDLKSLRGFFMGVLRWTPHTVMREATLEDLADACDGYRRHHSDTPPDRGFLEAMRQTFPDALGPIGE